MHVFSDLWIQWSNCPFFVAKKDLHWNCLAEKGKSGYFCQDAKFCSTPRMTFRKVTPAALKVNVKKFWQVILVPWHVWAPIWVHFAPWWSIFPVKNRFSHIFPAPEELPFLTVIFTVKLARLARITKLKKESPCLWRGRRWRPGCGRRREGRWWGRRL